MLKFLNRNKDGKEREFRISITSVQGGAMVEIDQSEDGASGREEANILLTPMDAAFFIHNTETREYKACPPVGHGTGGTDLRVYTVHSRAGDEDGWDFVGCPGECEIIAGVIDAYVPSFVVEAMSVALEQMMDSLLYPTTGDMEEAFG